MDVLPVASASATFSGTLFGFAVAGYILYMTRLPEPGPGDGKVDVLVTNSGELQPIGNISTSGVLMAGFYTMVSLGSSAFLFYNLAGRSNDLKSGWGEAALLVYGIILALSVLTLFYFTTLMLLERPPTRAAARPAFWVSTIAGPLVVLRFVAESAQDARLARCLGKRPCDPGWLFSTGSITLLLIFTATLFVAMTWSRLLERGWRRKLLVPLARRPTFPAVCVFIASFAVATLASLYINSRDTSHVPPGWLIVVIYAMGIILIILFTLGAGSVIYPRVNGLRITELPAMADADVYQELPGWERIWVKIKEMRNSVYLKHRAGTRPVRQGGMLIWKISAATRQEDEQVSTQFQVWHDTRPWRLGGKLQLTALGAANIPAEDDHRVQVTLTMESGAGERRIDEKISMAIPVEFDDEFSTYDRVRITVKRLDSLPGDVLLCWREAGGTIALVGDGHGAAPANPDS
jgi:hypothetical protein